MKRALWLAMIAISSLALAQEAAKEAAPAAAAPGIPPALAERIRAYTDAVVKRDVAALEDLWADDYAFVNPHGNLVTKKQRLENVKSGKTALEVTARQNERVQTYGDTVVTAGRITLKGRYGGKATAGEYRSLMVWVNQQGRWRLAANQLTPIARR